MGPESSAAASPSSSSPAASGKRARDHEDEVYVDNLHSHKRYLSEIMASSLNGLTVGDPLPDNIMDSPVRSEIMMPYLRDETSVQYSPMLEDSDDSRYYESSTNTCSSQPESAPTSPVSPYRCQKPPSGFVSGPATTSYPSHGSIVSSASSPQRQRGSDTEGRFPSSPSDICHSADLRRAALLRSVQMRTQPSGSSQFEMQLSLGQDSGSNIEVEERPCSYMKVDVDERVYPIAECTPLIMSESENRKKPCRTLGVNLKDDESAVE
ncbi:pollen-specific LRR extensin-like protein [Perilla frutescens var. frutescens]|nr:pollen-specific LRR extensin-like protein [Perilla frutescens var. frutescens]